MKIDKDFFNERADVVAKRLLGKIIVRKIGKDELRARIVETEAYFDSKDPASRACQNGDLKKTMEMPGGTILVYGVHNNWLINFVTGNKGEASAVLIRALEPLNFESFCNGPGLLTKNLGVGKELHKKSVLDSEDIWLEHCNEDGEESGFEIVDSFRVGVSHDLPEKMRFYIKDSRFVSRK
jgi:DNA-3-methyladenine glycosylase